MNGETLLLRQIHPSFVRGGRVTSQAFRPTPKDEDRLSTEDGDRIAPEAAWRRYTEVLALLSTGVMGILAASCAAEGLAVEPDGAPTPEHVSVIFAGLTTGERERVSKRLRDAADARGWLYRPSAGVA